MASKITRRPKRIEHPKPKKIDDELRELAEVLDERRIEHNREGWFSIPWRSGFNAIELTVLAFDRHHDEWSSVKERQISEWLSELVANTNALELRQKGATTYWEAGDLLHGIDISGVSSVDEVSPLLYAGLRCAQVFTSDSSGGGTVYNIILKLAFERVTVPDHLFEDCVLEARCLDAIGTSAQMRGDINDRTRRAFSIAWKRGLFHAAYSLPPIPSTTIGTTLS